MKLEIKFLNAIRFTKLFIAASRWLARHSDVLNDLNVYPIPDGDTGTNMSMTLQTVENELIKLDREINMEELREIVSDAILLGAKGVSGEILAQFVSGFLSCLGNKEQVTVDDVAKAFEVARERAYSSIEKPEEGGMLTVIADVTRAAKEYKGSKDDFILFLVHLKNKALESVDETPNIMPKLREAGVVDAGGKGFFYILEGFEKSVTDPEMLKELERIVKSQASRRERLEISTSVTKIVHSEICYSMEYVIDIENIELDNYKKELSEVGRIIAHTKGINKLKNSVKTKNPKAILEIAMRYGHLNNMKIEEIGVESYESNTDIKNISSENNLSESETMAKSSKKDGKIAIVTDSTSDLDINILEATYSNIKIIPLKVNLGVDQEFIEGINLNKKEFWNEILNKKSIAKSVHPSPTEFKEFYEKLLEEGYETIISLHVSSKISGTAQSAKVGKKLLEKRGENITVIDSKSISLGLAQQVKYLEKMCSENTPLDEMFKNLEEFQTNLKLFFVLNDRKYLEKIGKIGSARTLIGDVLSLKTIFKIEDGEIKVEGKKIGERVALNALVNIIEKYSEKGLKNINFAWGGQDKERLIVEGLKKSTSKFKNINIQDIYEIGATVGANTGALYAVTIAK